MVLQEVGASKEIQGPTMLLLWKHYVPLTSRDRVLWPQIHGLCMSLAHQPCVSSSRCERLAQQTETAARTQAPALSHFLRLAIESAVFHAIELKEWRAITQCERDADYACEMLADGGRAEN